MPGMLMFRPEFYNWLVGPGRLLDWPYDPDAFAAAYWASGGDPAAMVDLLMAGPLGEIANSLRDAPPLMIDGISFPPSLVMRYQLGLTVEGIIAEIEGHGETRH